MSSPAATRTRTTCQTEHTGHISRGLCVSSPWGSYPPRQHERMGIASGTMRMRRFPGPSRPLPGKPFPGKPFFAATRQSSMAVRFRSRRS